jgi:hypothetical protein
MDTSKGEGPSNEGRVVPSRVKASVWLNVEVKRAGEMNASVSESGLEGGGEVSADVSEDTTGPQAAESRRVISPRRGEEDWRGALVPGLGLVWVWLGLGWPWGWRWSRGGPGWR